MKILITGATGSLGAYLVRYFSKPGHEIIATGRDKKAPPKLLEYAQYLEADITKTIKLPEADVCIHAAALSDDKGAWEEFYKANVTGTRNVLEAVKDCKIFVHISSSSVYLPEDEPISEELAGEQDNKLLSNYGESKLESEKVIHDISKHEKCFILRPRALYGVGDKKILPRMLHLEKKGKIFKPGNMLVDISMAHYENIAHAIDCCLISELKGMHTYNVSDDNKYVLIDVMRKFTETLYGFKLPEKKIPLSILKIMALLNLGGITPLLIRSLTKNMVLDISKIKKELNYKPKTNIESNLDELKDWVNFIGGVEVLKRAEKKLAWHIK